MKLRGLFVVAFAGCLVASTGSAWAARIADSDHGGRPLEATLVGTNEVPPRSPTQTGTALVTLNQGQAEVCFELTVAGISSPITAAHIHAAPAGTNGPIVISFNQPINGLDGCVTADPDLIKAVRQNPSDYYVNVHTQQFRGGAIRGQLSK